MSAREMDWAALAKLSEACCEAIRPKFAGTTADWVKSQRVKITAQQNVTYSGEIYDFDRFPVVASLVFGFFDDPNARELFVGKNVQTACTTACFFAVAHELAEGEGGNVIYIMHGRDDARDKVKDVLKPMFSQIKGLENNIDVATDDSNAMALRFGRGTLLVGGGQSVSTLTSTPASTVLLDEFARHAFLGGKTTADLARERLTGANNSKLVAFSKPEEEAVFIRNEKTGRMQYEPRPMSLMDGEWLAGDQRQYHCPCPKCGVWQPIRWDDIQYSHLNEAPPGKQPVYNFKRFPQEVHWRCPSCQHKVFEGEEKRKMILAGKAGGVEKCWPPCPAEQRRAAGMFPYAHPGKWSATISALTDIAFDSLKWGKLAERWVTSQGDPTKLTAFLTGVLGIPEPHIKQGDTTLDHLRRLIPGPESRSPAPWRMRDAEGRLTGIIPIENEQMDYVGMACDVQKDRIKYTVRAFGKDGRRYLLDYGAMQDLPDIEMYLDGMEFRTLDGGMFKVFRCYIDVGHRQTDVLDFCWDNQGKGVEGIRGDQRAFGSACWPGVRRNSDKPIEYHTIDNQHWERHLYYRQIQGYDPRRYVRSAPAMYFPMDIEDDYLRELTAMKETREVTPAGAVKVMFKKVNSSMENDYGDCEKYLCVMDYNNGVRWPHVSGEPEQPGLQPDVDGDTEGEPVEGERKIREYRLK